MLKQGNSGDILCCKLMDLEIWAFQIFDFRKKKNRKKFKSGFSDDIIQILKNGCLGMSAQNFEK